jgi:hypothetical protein
MDSFEGERQNPVSLHKYLYVADNPVNMSDPSGKDAAVVNIWGYTGHTCFILTNPKGGGVRVYHFFAKGHNANANSLQNIQGVIYDKEWLWHEDRSSFGAYLDELAKEKPITVSEQAYLTLTGYKVQIQAYAVGTHQDDQRLFDYLNDEADQNDGYYSLITGEECHHASWGWFHDYAGWDSPVATIYSYSSVSGLSPSGGKYISAPTQVYMTKQAKMPSLQLPPLQTVEMPDLNLP